MATGGRLLIAGTLAAVAVIRVVSASDERQVASMAGAAGGQQRVALSGPWILRSDHRNRGLRRGWSRGGFSGSEVDVPYVPNARPDRLTPRRIQRAYNGTIAWYRTSFRVPRDGTWALDFGSVQHRATVWVDGRLRARHVGAYLPFSATFKAKAGVHTVVVRADYRDPLQMKRDGWHRTWFNYGGINRAVTLRPLTRSDVLWPTVRTRLDGGTAVVSLSAHVRNRGPSRVLRLRGSLTNGDQAVDFGFPSLRVPRGAVRVFRTRVRIPDPALWSPPHPNLYALSLSVPGETTWTGRTGLRQFTWRGRTIYLNGRRLALHGASIPEDAYGRGDGLRPADMDELVSELKTIGANATRSQHPLAPALLDRLDEAGIVVWQGIGPIDSPGAFREDTPTRLRKSRERSMQSYRELQLHPSIMVWSLANEVGGDGHPGGQAAYIDRMARLLHRRDPGRMVGVDVWGAHPPASDRGLLLYRNLDVIGVTNYLGWYEDVRLEGAGLRRGLRRNMSKFARAFPDKVMMVTEFGGEANPNNPTDSPGGYAFQQRLLAEHIGVYARDRRYAGMILWSLRDFEVSPHFLGGSIRLSVPNIRIRRGLNTKGLFSYQGKPKPSVQTVGDLYRAIPTFP